MNARALAAPELEDARDHEYVARLAAAARTCFVLAAVMSALVLLGWLDGERVDRAFLMMKPTSALCVLLLGLALRLKSSQVPARRRWLPLMVLVGAAQLMALNAFLAVAGLPYLQLDALLSSQSLAPGRMTTSAALDVVLLGAVVPWLDGREHSLPRPVLALTLLALCLALGALAGYAYGVEPQHMRGTLPMLPLTALAHALLCVGVLLTRVPPDVARVIASRSASASAMRRLLLGLLSIPIGLGCLERLLFHQGLYQTELGVAMLMVGNMVLVFALTIHNMRALLSAQRQRAQLERDLETNREIAARYRAQEALRQSEEKYRALAVHAPVGIFEASVDGRCTFVNERWSEITGYSPEEAQDRGWNRVVHPEDSPRLNRVWAESLARSEPFSLDFRYQTKAGQVAWVHGAAVPLKDAEGRVTGLMGTIVDMTERRRTLDRLSQSEANFRLLVERAPFGVLVSRKLQIVYANSTFLRMMGYDGAGELTGKSMLSLVHPDAHDLLAERDEARSEGEVLPPLLARCLRRDGSEITIEGQSTNLMFDGELSTVSVARDVTERERSELVRRLAESNLRESLREKDVLLKEIHHRVKNNLQVIVSLINLQAAKLEDGPQRSVFEETRSRVHAIALLHERLYTSKNLGRIDMRDYLDGLASDLSSNNTGARSIELHVRADELYLPMDTAVPIGLIVNELVTNAYKHAFPARLERGGTIRVALERTPDALRIVVEDDGVGLPAGLDADSADTLGLLLISSLSRQLEGELQFDAGSRGARCVVHFPDRARSEGLAATG